MKKIASWIAAVSAALGSSMAFAVPIYLNIDNMTVAEGPGSTYTSSNNTFNNGQTLDKVIDAPSADAEEFHNQTTHLWFSGGALELEFDFGQQYDLTTLHFWNYTGESFDVDNIAFSFFDADGVLVGELEIMPALGSSPGIRAEDIFLPAPLNVQFVTAVLTGSNDQVDFQNMGFTGDLSVDRCLTNPDDPICDNGTEPPVDPPVTPPSTSVPEPGTMVLLGLGLLGMGIRRLR